MTDKTLMPPPPADLAPLLRPILLTEPDRLVPPGAWVGHLPFAFWLIDVLRPRVLVELGVHSGNSFCGFCQAVQTLALTTACYGIDSWRGDPQAGFYGEEVFAELKRWHDPRYGSFSRLVRSSFAEALEHFPDGTIDLLHIDGYHTYEAVAEDFAGWQSKLSPRAVVLFHDINVRERDFGVWRLWREVAAGRPHFTFLHSHGLGVLAPAGIDAPALDWLFSAAGSEAAAIRTLFARLGTIFEARLALAVDAAGAELTAASGSVGGPGGREGLEAARDALAIERDALAETLRSQQGEIDALVAEIVARDRQLAAAQADLQMAEERHQAALTAMQAQADTYTRSQDETVQRLHDVAADACARRDAVGREIDTLRADYQALDAARQDCRSLHTVVEEQYQALQAAHQDLESEHQALVAAYRDLVADRDARLPGLEAEIAALRGSTSWRLTAPLRALGRLLRGG